MLGCDNLEQIALHLYVENEMNDDEMSKFLCQAELESSKQFDQLVVALAGGAIGLSMTFAKDLKAPVAKWVLGLSWVVLAVSILSVLMSHSFSQMSLRKQREINSSENKAKINRYSDLTNLLNWISLVAVVSGILVMSWFVVSNIKDQEADVNVSKSSLSKIRNDGFVAPMNNAQIEAATSSDDPLRKGFVAPKPPPAQPAPTPAPVSQPDKKKE
jgi:hypothetical protein